MKVRTKPKQKRNTRVTSISLPPELYNSAIARALMLDREFSNYIVTLIRRDLSK